MRPSGFKLSRKIKVIVQVVLGALWVTEIAGEADGTLHQLTGLARRINGHTHILNPVERIEYPEDIDTAGRSLFNKIPHDVVGIIGVAHGVRGTQQHLRENVRHTLAQSRQALPWALVEKTHRDIKGCTTPALH